MTAPGSESETNTVSDLWSCVALPGYGLGDRSFETTSWSETGLTSGSYTIPASAWDCALSSLSATDPAQSFVIAGQRYAAGSANRGRFVPHEQVSFRGDTYAQRPTSSAQIAAVSTYGTGAISLTSGIGSYDGTSSAVALSGREVQAFALVAEYDGANYDVTEVVGLLNDGHGTGSGIARKVTLNVPYATLRSSTWTYRVNGSDYIESYDLDVPAVYTPTQTWDTSGAVIWAWGYRNVSDSTAANAAAALNDWTAASWVEAAGSFSDSTTDELADVVDWSSIETSETGFPTDPAEWLSMDWREWGSALWAKVTGLFDGFDDLFFPIGWWDQHSGV